MKPGDKVNTWQIVVNNDSNNNLASVPLIQTDNPAASETSSTNPIYELNQAIQDNRLSSFKKYLAACEDINEKDKDGNTPLHLAVRLGNLIMVKSLLRKGANVGLVDEQGNTPLHLAVLENKLEIAKLLLEHIVTTGEIKDKDGKVVSPKDLINLPNQNGETPLHCAVYEGNLEMVKSLLKKGANVWLVDKDGNTPLRCAALKKKLAIADVFLEHIVKAGGIKDKDGNTPLHLAVKRGNLAMVKSFLKKGANVGLVDKDGNTPLHLAVLENKLEIAKLLLEHIVTTGEIKDKDGKVVSPQDLINLPNCFQQTALHLAVYEGNLEMVKSLLKKGANVGLVDKNGDTPLRCAALENKTEIVDFLLEHIVKAGEIKDKDGKVVSPKDLINLPDQFQQTALHFAIDTGNLEMVKSLLKKGANVGLVDKDGNTPLHFAVKKRNLEMVKFLLKKGANVGLVDFMGYTPLHRALFAKHLEIAKLLLKHIVKAGGIKDKDGKVVSPKDLINLPNCFKQTALHLAVYEGNLEMVQSLVKKGANVGLVDTHGETPLHVAIKKRNLEMVTYLLKKGANAGVADINGKTPLHVAVLKDKLEIAKLLLEHIVKAGEIKDKDDKVVSPEDLINHWDNTDTTPLHLVGSVAMFELLLNMGANPNITDKAGLSVRDIISNNHHYYTFDARKALEAWDQKWRSEIKIPITDFSTAGNPNVAGNSQVEVDTEVAGVEPMDISAPE